MKDRPHIPSTAGRTCLSRVACLRRRNSGSTCSRARNIASSGHGWGSTSSPPPSPPPAPSPAADAPRPSHPWRQITSFVTQEASFGGRERWTKSNACAENNRWCIEGRRARRGVSFVNGFQFTKWPLVCRSLSISSRACSRRPRPARYHARVPSNPNKLTGHTHGVFNTPQLRTNPSTTNLLLALRLGLRVFSRRGDWR